MHWFAHLYSESCLRFLVSLSARYVARAPVSTAGVPAAHVHRLLLGLSTTGQDMRPWLELAGSCVPALHRSSGALARLCALAWLGSEKWIKNTACDGCLAFAAWSVRHYLSALRVVGDQCHACMPYGRSCAVCSGWLTADPARLYQLLQQRLTECNGAALSRHLGSPDHLQLLSTAVHIGTDSDTLLSLLVGSLGLPAPSQAPAAAAAAGSATSSNPAAQQLQRASVLAAGAAAADAAPTAMLASLGVGIGLQLLPLVGVLASKYGHDARELGGPVTEALVQAQLSTVARVQEMEARCRSLHRWVLALLLV